MRTSIDLAKSEATDQTEAINGVKRTQNRIRHQKKKTVEELNENIGSVIRHTNDENIDNNIVNNNENIVINNNNNTNNSRISRPSIGKWMYESEDSLPEEVAIDLSNTQPKNSTKTWVQQKQSTGVGDQSDDDVMVIANFSAGPSGVNAVPNDRNLNILSDLASILSPSLVSNTPIDLVFDEEVFDINAEDIQQFVAEADAQRADTQTSVTETITIDDSIEDEDSAVVSNQTPESTAADDVEIIRVKYLNEPNDSDIEVLSEILSPQEVIDVMRVHLKNAQSLTQLSFTTIRLFMTKYQWNKDLFVDHFFEFGIQELLNRYKLVISYQLKNNPNKRRRLRRHSPSKRTEPNETISGSLSTSESMAEPQELKTCLICFEEINATDMFAINCEHIVCVDCWNQYLDAHLGDRSSAEMVTCPGDNCPNIVDDDDLLAIIRDQKSRDKFQRLISNSFVQKNPLLKWCPNGDCLHAVRVKENGFQDVECICKTVFCFLCGDRWHEPLSCQQHENWIQRYASQTVDTQSAKWLTHHTKCCPKCRFPIEKNGGCNYVMCLKCRHQFCYSCLGRCAHGRCLGQNAPDAQAAQASDQFLKNDLQIYPTIKNQYQMQSNRFAHEDKLQKDVARKLEKAVKCPEFRSALKFLKSAFTVLCHCRQTLMYSYVFGYYLMGPHYQQAVYAHNLKELEEQTDRLSQMLVTETVFISRDAVPDLKSKVRHNYRECEAKRSQLVLHIRQGLAQNQWQFSALSNCPLK